MSITLETLQEFHNIGLAAIPIIWDNENKKEVALPIHGEIKEGVPTLDFITKWMNNLKAANGIAIKLFSPFGMLDFDLKNTENKEVYNEWFNIIQATNEDVLKKVCIEKTRSGGFHVYIKYPKLDHKIPVARSAKDEEVISVYTGGLLSYCAPNAGYEIIHNDFSDLEELTDDEFDLFVSTAALFNESKIYKSGQSKVAFTTYPTEYENTCLQFDYKCTAETFEHILNSINLYRVDKSQFRRKHFIPFLRRGSTAVYSAKVYFDYKVEFEGRQIATSHRLLIFSASMSQFPNWSDAAKSEDSTWSLSPARIIFYKNNQDWTATIEEIRMIADSACIDIVEPTPVTKQELIPYDRLKFPYDVLPVSLQNYILAHPIQYEYTANILLTACSTAIGNSVTLMATNSYKVKPVMYMAIVAPSGGGKTPAMTAAYKALENQDAVSFSTYAEGRKDYEKLKADPETKKHLPEEPVLSQMIIKDSTIEMVIKVLSHNPIGCVVYADELSGFMKRIDKYQQGDEIQKWLELWSGSSILLQRISREANKVENPFCNIVGGIQGGILGMFSQGDNEFNGFYQRFLFVYPEPEDKQDWGAKDVPNDVIREYGVLFHQYFAARETLKTEYRLSPEADSMYGEWFNYKNKKYNSSTSDHVKGIISKYQNYCLRFAVLLQAMHEGLNRSGFIDKVNMERAIRLTEYYLGMMQKVTKLLVPESPTDKLQDVNKKLYDLLPEMFTTKKAVELGATINIKETAVKVFLGRNIKGKNQLFRQLGRGEYEKIY